MSERSGGGGVNVQNVSAEMEQRSIMERDFNPSRITKTNRQKTIDWEIDLVVIDLLP